MEDDGFYHCISKSNAVQSIGSKRLIVNELRKDFNNLGAMNFGIFHKIEYCLPESRELRCALLAVPSYDHHVHKKFYQELLHIFIAGYFYLNNFGQNC
ncbi:unnamed protein product [Wuchereria bancrofti]|uniref:Uncharacterized protein n=1 Tax=Wuchereria bancrofti TaxID=6293 RepID=A0A3P7EIR8_WUCBA|nr:unnamed protein product [Wuchereria bancrofti]